MKNLFVLGIVFVVSGCSSFERVPSSEQTLQTRDGRQVTIPGLRNPLVLPACEAERKDLDECVPAGEQVLFEEITRISFRFQEIVCNGSAHHNGIKAIHWDILS